ncbi:MAG: TraB/GumN family protein [Chitinophagaceae bacterium]|nr:TraB/GumN family protein [Chitinophagaceae bacterium]
MIEKYKPLLASAMLMESTMVCEEQVAMEQLIMEEAKKHGKSIEGMETAAFQMSIFDSIPYKIQAEELAKMVSVDNKEAEGEKELKDMMDAYREQDLTKLGDMISKSEAGMMQYEDILLNNRNHNWTEKMKKLMPEKSLVVAVGAGHLPGDKGVINLLRKAGFTVEPVVNKVRKTKSI